MDPKSNKKNKTFCFIFLSTTADSCFLNVISDSVSPCLAYKALLLFFFFFSRGLKSPKSCFSTPRSGLTETETPEMTVPWKVCLFHLCRSNPLWSSSFSPILLAASPCELYCRPLNEQFSEKMLDAVADGTPCYEGNKSRDICINGICKVSPRQFFLPYKMQLFVFSALYKCAAAPPAMWPVAQPSLSLFSPQTGLVCSALWTISAHGFALIKLCGRYLPVATYRPGAKMPVTGADASQIRSGHPSQDFNTLVSWHLVTFLSGAHLLGTPSVLFVWPRPSAAA